MRLKTILIFLSFFSISLFSNHGGSESIVLSTIAQIDRIDKALGNDASVDEVTYDSDVRLEQAEFNYLMDIKDGVPTSIQSIKKGIEYLFKKKKYETITLSFNQTNNRSHCHIVLTGLWTFKKLKLSGMLINKEFYRQYYTMESGEPFDRIKHDCALEKIKEAFAQEGYYAATVDSECSYDYESKQVTVTLALKKKSSV